MNEEKYITPAEANKVMPAATQEKYRVTKEWGNNRTSTRVVFPKFGDVNLKTLSVSKADQLVKMGFPYLAVKTKKESSSSK